MLEYETAPSLGKSWWDPDCGSRGLKLLLLKSLSALENSFCGRGEVGQWCHIVFFLILSCLINFILVLISNFFNSMNFNRIGSFLSLCWTQI